MKAPEKALPKSRDELYLKLLEDELRARGGNPSAPETIPYPNWGNETKSRKDFYEYQRQRRKKNKWQSRGYYFKWAYNLSKEQYEELLTLQKGVCAICNTPPPEGKLLLVDHDHETEQVRGLLCNSCNGKLSYNLEWLERAVSYILGDKGYEGLAEWRDKPR